MAGAAFGSGFSIYEQGAKATAMGGAFTATADDPSAIFYNVAGIAQQRQTSFLAGGTAINFSNEFSGASDDVFTAGSTGQYNRHTFIPPNGYFIMPIGNNLTFGLGAFAAYGLRTDWEEPFIGRFNSKDANVKTLSIEPAIAWQTTDGRFAVGVGAEYRRAHVILSRNNPLTTVNPFNQRFVDVASVYLNSDWESAWGYNVGFLFKPSDRLRFGLAYRSDMDIDFKGKATFTQIPTGNAQIDALVAAGLPPNQNIATTLAFPSTTAAGIGGKVGNWDVDFDATRTTWSRFKTLDVAFATTPTINLHRVENWKDTWSWRLGGNRAVTPDWDVRLGAVYDQNPQPTSSVSPLLPDADRIGVAFGVGWHRGPFVFDATEFALHFKTRSTNGISQDRFNGTYKTNANLISVNVGYKF